MHNRSFTSIKNVQVKHTMLSNVRQNKQEERLSVDAGKAVTGGFWFGEKGGCSLCVELIGEAN